MPRQKGEESLIGHRLLDRDGNSIGKIGQVFFDDQTDAPKWITVRTGLFGTSENFVPLQGARTVDDDVQVPYPKDTVRDAPSFHTDRHVSVRQEDLVYRHYGLLPEAPGQRGPEQTGWPRGRHARPTARVPEPGPEFAEFIEQRLANHEDPPPGTRRYGEGSSTAS